MIDGENNSGEGVVEAVAFEATSAYPTYASQVFLSSRLQEAPDGLTPEETQGLSFILALLADDARAEHEAQVSAE